MTRLATFLLLLAFAFGAGAAEKVSAFAATLAIQADGSLLVTETIDVAAEGDKIRRGIFRDFPTDYRDRHGQRVRVGFEVISVTRGGVREPWFTERQSNGVRVYIGDKNISIAPGEHRYEIRYRTTRQLGHFAEHDELYWNVTGNGWIFPIEAASADVMLPSAAPATQLRLEGWTGYAGSKGQAVAAELRDGGGRIRATRALGPEEGLTIALTFPKGVVAEPGIAQKARWWASDNRGVFVAITGFLLVWAWYLWRWWRYGRDPAPGVVIPEYEAPDDLPPSVLRYVRDMDYSSATFASDLMHLAQQGHLSLANNEHFVVTKLRDDMPADPVAAAFLPLMFAKSDQLEVKTGAHVVLVPTRAQHGEAVVKSNNGRWFHRNGWSLAIGIIAATVAMIAGFALQGDPGAGIVGGICAVLLSVAAAVAVNCMRRVLRGEGWARVGAAFATLVVLAFCAALGLALAVLSGTVMFAVVAGFALTNALFAMLLPAYTPEGRRLLDRIEGFTRYLSVAEKADLARMKAPPMDGERFAKFLPYAQALGVEQAWSAKLVAALGAAAAIEATRQSVGTWYHSNSATDFTPSSFASEIGSSFNSSISSAATPPGSSSGGGYSGGGGGGHSSSGGGSSGGGGGGGGGGGW